MNNALIRSQLRTLAARAGDLRPRNPAEIALLGHLLGAVYALTQAESVRAPERSNDMLLREYPAELRRVSSALARDKPRPQSSWVADFQLNSALYRLASLAERLPKHMGQDRRLIKDVSNDVNQMKHDVPGRLVPRAVVCGEGLRPRPASCQRLNR